MLGDATRVRVDVGTDETDLHAPRVRRRRPAAGRPRWLVETRRPEWPPGYPWSRPVPSRRTRPPTSSRASRPRLRSCCPNVPSWPAVSWKVPPCSVARVSIARRRSPASRPGKVVQPVPIASSACASLLPTWASPCWSANRTTRRCHGLPRLVGLNVSRPSGRPAGVRVGEEAAKDPALRAERVRDERVGRDRQAAGVVDRGDRRPQATVRPDRPVEIEREQVAAERRDLLADHDLDAQTPDRAPSTAPASAASIRSWSVIAITSRSVARSTCSRIDSMPAVPSLASVWMWRSARPSAPGVGHAAAPSDPRAADAAAASARGPARSGRRPPTTGPGHRR